MSQGVLAGNPPCPLCERGDLVICHCEESFFRKDDSSLTLGAGSAISAYSLVLRLKERLLGYARNDMV